MPIALLDRLRGNPLERGTTAQRTVRAVLLACALALAGLLQWTDVRLPGAQLLEAGSRDALMRVFATEHQDPRVAIVDIDESSLERFGPWPWPRERLADLAERLLSEAGASRVVFDLVLTDPARGHGTGDARLAALARAGALVAAQAFDYEARDTRVAVSTAGGAWTSGGQHAGLAVATGYVGNFSELARARCVGNIGFIPDFDGQIRRIAPLTEWNGAAYPTLALAALACSRAPAEVSALAQRLPRDSRGFWRIPFTRRPESYFAVSAAEVLAGNFDRDGASAPLAGRLVLVGSSAMGLADRVATPLSPSVSGVTVHAAVLSWLLDLSAGVAPPTPPAWLMPIWSALSILALGWSVSGTHGRLRRVASTAAVVAPGWAAAAAWVALTGSVQPVSGALAGYALVLLVQLPLEWSWGQARLRRHARLLSRYVAPSVLVRLLRSRAPDPLAPRYARITVLIADMQDYTRNTAHSSLDEAARLTKGFLDELTRPVLENRGTLDRYTGDGLVSFWGAPIADDDHADRAVDAALAIVANVASFNERRRREGLMPVVVRMGLASGDALVGDLGTPFRISYTAVGDCINLASRLQQASREAHVNILAAGSVAQGCRRHAFRAIGTMPVRGLPDQEVFTPASAPDLPSTAATGPAAG